MRFKCEKMFRDVASRDAPDLLQNFYLVNSFILIELVWNDVVNMKDTDLVSTLDISCKKIEGKISYFSNFYATQDLSNLNNLKIKTSNLIDGNKENNTLLRLTRRKMF